MQFGPSSLTPPERAIAASRSCAARPSSPISATPEPNTIVPPQSAIVVDLRDDLIGALTICGPTQSCVAIPDDLWSAALAALPFTARLSADEQARLRALAEQCVAEIARLAAEK